MIEKAAATQNIPPTSKRQNTLWALAITAGLTTWVFYPILQLVV